MTEINTATFEPTVIESQTPPEPSVGSVVLTADGMAWQSRKYSKDYAPFWYSTASSFVGYRWDQFITKHRSVTLIYTPED